MEVIKIENLLEEYIDDSLTEQECDIAFDLLTKVINEAYETNSVKPYKELLSEEMSVMDTANKRGIAAAIKLAGQILKSRYAANAQKMLNQSKEVNDLFTKITNMIEHDREVMFKHGNDLIDATVRYTVLKNKNDMSKDYRVGIEFIAYDPQYYIKKIDETMKYVTKYSKDKKTDINAQFDALVAETNDSFNQRHPLAVNFYPLMKAASYKNQRLKDVIDVFKREFSVNYNNIGTYNNYTSIQAEYIQYIQQAYNSMIIRYGSDKDVKPRIDEIFTLLLKNSIMCMDFNDKCITVQTEVYKYYCKELEKIYNIINN